MVPSKFNVERTAAGQQFVIPGTEKPRPVSRPRYAKDGTQIGPKALLTRLLDKPLRPRVGQRSLSGTSLFGTGKPK
jgi:hypothetical protein